MSYGLPFEIVALGHGARSDHDRSIDPPRLRLVDSGVAASPDNSPERRARPSSARQIGAHARKRSEERTGGTRRARTGRTPRDARDATVAAGVLVNYPG